MEYIHSSQLIPASTPTSSHQAQAAESMSTTDGPSRRSVTSPVNILKRRTETLARTTTTDATAEQLSTLTPVARAETAVSATVKSSSTTIQTQETRLGKDDMLSKSNRTPPQAEKTNKGPSPRRQFHSVVAGLPLYSYSDSNLGRKVTYSRKVKSSSQAAERVLLSGASLVGFDLEWKPMRSPKEYNRVSLVQIATETEVLLVQLSGGGRVHDFPPALKTLLESPSIMKVGAGIDGDVDKLQRDWGVQVQNYLDLADMARSLDPFWNTCDVVHDFALQGAMGIDWSEAYDNPESPNISPSVEESIPYGDLGVNASEASSLLQSPPVTPPAPHSLPNVPERHFTGNAYPKGRCIALARLISRYRGKRLDKGPQLSNWAAPLSKNQIEYAANDGCAGYDVYNSLVRLERADAGWKERQSEHYKNIVAAHNLAIAAQSLPTPDVDRNTSEGTKLTALPKKQPSLSSISASIVGVTIKRPSLVQDKDNVNADPTSYPSPPVTPIMVRTMTAILPSPNTSFQTEWGSVPSTGSRLQPAQSLPPAVSPQAFHEALWNLRRPQYMSQTSPAPPFHHPTQTPYYSPYPHTPDRGTAYQFSGAWTPEGPELGNQHGWISPVPFHGVYPMNGPSPSMEQHPPMWRRASGSLLDSPSVSSYHYHSSYSLQPSSVPKDGWVSNFNTISLKEPSRPRHRTHVSASVTSVTAPIGDLFKEHKDLSETKKAIRDAITSRHENE